MNKRQSFLLNPLALAAFGLALILFSSCATYSANTVNKPRSPLEQAKLNYVTGSMDYDFSLKVIRELRAARLIVDAQWTRVQQAVTIAQEWAPLVERMLTMWERYCTPENCPPPPNYHETSAKLSAAFAEIRAVKNEAQR